MRGAIEWASPPLAPGFAGVFVVWMVGLIKRDCDVNSVQNPGKAGG